MSEIQATGYRARIYGEYVSGFRGRETDFDSEAAKRWGRPYEYYFRGWLPPVRDARIVDLACGDGQFLYFLRERGYTHLRGVDLSAEQVQIARAVTPNVERQNVIDFLRDVGPMAFDMVVALDFVEHLTKAEVLTFLDLCFVSLKPGGRLVLQTPNADSPMCTAIRYGDFTHELCFTPNLLSRLLGMAGFAEIEAREMAPVPRGCGPKSSLRYAAWRGIRTAVRMWNLIETGSAGSGVHTRVFCVTARVPRGESHTYEPKP